MGQAWGICPVCGKVLALDPVDAPGEPIELTQHLQSHRSSSLAETPSPASPIEPFSAAAPPARPPVDRPHAPARPPRKAHPERGQ